MDKFLETYKLLKVNHKELENLNRSIMSKDISSVNRKFQQQKPPRTDGFTSEFYQTLNEKLIFNLSQTLPNNCRGGNTPKLVLEGLHYPDNKVR